MSKMDFDKLLNALRSTYIEQDEQQTTLSNEVVGTLRVISDNEKEYMSDQNVQKIKDKAGSSGLGCGGENIRFYNTEEIRKLARSDNDLCGILTISKEYPWNVDIWLPNKSNLHEESPMYCIGLHFRMSLYAFESFLDNEDLGIAKVHLLFTYLRDVFVNNGVMFPSESVMGQQEVLYFKVVSQWIKRAILTTADVLREYYDLRRSPREIRVRQGVVSNIMKHLTAKQPNGFEKQISGGNYKSGHRVWHLPGDKGGNLKVAIVPSSSFHRKIHEKPQLVITSVKDTHTAIAGMKCGTSIFYGEVDADTIQDMFYEWTKMNWSNDRFIAEVLKSSIHINESEDYLKDAYGSREVGTTVTISIDYLDRLSNLLETVKFRMEK